MTWENCKANVNSVHVLKSISRVHTTICTNSKLSVIDVVKTLARCFWGLESRKVLSFAVYTGLFWGWNQSVFWPPFLATGSMSHPAHSPTTAFIQEIHKWVNTHMQPHLSQSLTAGQKLFPKKGRNMWAMGAKHNWAYYSWAHELTDWFYLFSLEFSVRLNALCSVR